MPSHNPFIRNDRASIKNSPAGPCAERGAEKQQLLASGAPPARAAVFLPWGLDGEASARSPLPGQRVT